MDSDYWINKLELAPHPEGGWYKETYRAMQVFETKRGKRNASTAIYFLLSGQQKSHFHRIQSDEQWFFHEGATLEILMLDGNELKVFLLGKSSDQGECLQVTIPAGCWFGSRVKDAIGFVLVSCTVSPGFDFDDFEMANSSELLTSYPRYSEVINNMCLK